MEQKQEVTLENAKDIVRKEKDERGIACNQSIGEILQKYQCDIKAIPMIDESGRIIAQIQIIPRELQ